MGKARRIDIGTRVFEKAGDGTIFFSAMLNHYSVGDRVSEADIKDLLALLNRHDEKAEKVGSGVDYVVVEAAPDGYAGKCFWIVRTDGTRVDFSYPHCLKRKPEDPD